ncbi:MAG: hypothetical protein K0U72_03000 [Gammaproteobacteria bacterium]|nr:hypothetical protein [Gammaproteobacteria bacterium]
MKFFLVATVLALASCATNSGAPHLESRLESWKGESIHELSKELGKPASMREDGWEWRFTGPGAQEAPSANALSRPMGSDIGSTTGRSLGVANNNLSWAATSDTSIPRKDCAYRAAVSAETIVSVEAVVVSGRCQFREIPFRAKD